MEKQSLFTTNSLGKEKTSGPAVYVMNPTTPFTSQQKLIEQLTIFKLPITFGCKLRRLVLHGTVLKINTDWLINTLFSNAIMISYLNKNSVRTVANTVWIGLSVSNCECTFN